MLPLFRYSSVCWLMAKMQESKPWERLRGLSSVTNSFRSFWIDTAASPVLFLNPMRRYVINSGMIACLYSHIFGESFFYVDINCYDINIAHIMLRIKVPLNKQSNILWSWLSSQMRNSYLILDEYVSLYLLRIKHTLHGTIAAFMSHRSLSLITC